ncbi:MAG TPA: hypothetical protein VGJ26_11480, partial [Pirellulales bacterium]
RLFAEKPHWRQYVEPNLNSELGLGVVVPAPNPRLTTGLYIDVDGGQITIGMDWYHVHVWGESEDTIEQAMLFIQEFVDEKIVLLAYFEGDKWIRSQCVGLEDPWRPPGEEERRLVFSWKANLDSEMIGLISN